MQKYTSLSRDVQFRSCERGFFLREAERCSADMRDASRVSAAAAAAASDADGSAVVSLEHRQGWALTEEGGGMSVIQSAQKLPCGRVLRNVLYHCNLKLSNLIAYSHSCGVSKAASHRQLKDSLSRNFIVYKD